MLFQLISYKGINDWRKSKNFSMHPLAIFTEKNGTKQVFVGLENLNSCSSYIPQCLMYLLFISNI